METFEFLGTLMSIIGGGISIADTIGNVVKVVKSNRSFDDEIRKALEKVTDDDFQRKRLITLSSDILHFAVRKLNNEKIILPPDIDEKEFNDFFNKVTKNKQTWFYLDEQLKNYKLANINNKLEFIKNDTKKIDSIIVKSDHIFENTEELGNKIDNLKRDADDVSEVTKDIKTKLSVPDWLRPYEKELSASSKIEFLDDASENLIREGKVYRNNSKIQRIKDYLDINKKCLIKAPEGRGKTYLSRIIAYDYYHDQRMEVYFVEFKDNGGIPISKIDDQLQVWNKNIEKNYLLILENCHAYQNLEGLSEKINTLCRTDCNNIRFLLNARPTDEGMDYFSEWKTMNLEPDATDLEGIINLYSQAIKDRNPFDTEKNRDDFIKEKILPKVNSVNGANLRLLNIYLKTWQNNATIPYVSEINESTILKEFIKHYDLDKFNDEEIEVLLYISSIFQFDTPMHKNLIPKGGISSCLHTYMIKGFLRKKNDRYHLPHSVDALYLCKAICYYLNNENYSNEYFDKTNEFVNQFIDSILISKNPQVYENDFKILVSGLLYRHAEFEVLIKQITEWDNAKEVIEKIDPGFLIKAFHPHNGHNKEIILATYLKDKKTIVPYILELSPGKLNQLRFMFENLLSYKDFCLDVFENPVVLQKYLLKWYKILDTTSSLRVFNKNREFKKRIMSISPNHTRVINYKPPVQNGYRFNTTPNKPTGYFISKRSTHYLFSLDVKKAEKLFHQINKKDGFYFKNCSWSHLAKMIYILHFKSTDDNRKICLSAGRKIIQAVVNEINKDSSAIQKATNEELSRFLKTVSDFDKTMFENLMKNNNIIDDAKFRLKWFDYTFSDLYLFSHFYSLDWCKKEMNRLFDEANKEQIQEIKNWHNYIMAKLEKSDECVEIEQGSLLDYIHNKFFNEQQNN